jgi:hypothetical protein
MAYNIHQGVHTHLFYTSVRKTRKSIHHWVVCPSTSSYGSTQGEAFGALKGPLAFHTWETLSRCQTNAVIGCAPHLGDATRCLGRGGAIWSAAIKSILLCNPPKWNAPRSFSGKSVLA